MALPLPRVTVLLYGVFIDHDDSVRCFVLMTRQFVKVTSDLDVCRIVMSILKSRDMYVMNTVLFYPCS